MRKILVTWEHESRKDSRELHSFRAVLEFKIGTGMPPGASVSCIEILTTDGLGKPSWRKPHSADNHATMCTEHVLQLATQALCAFIYTLDGGAWRKSLNRGVQLQQYEAAQRDDDVVMELSLGTVTK